MKKKAWFRFHHSLNDFLRRSQRDQFIEYSFNGNPPIKDAIEAIGIPHVEVNAIIIRHNPVQFTYLLKENEQVEVYPSSHKPFLPAEYTLQPYLTYKKFVLDVHLGSLARKLRLFGFDTAYQTNFTDHQIASIAQTEERIVLTRDIGLLKHKAITWGYWLRSQHIMEQLKEVIDRFEITKHVKPFSRCLKCNGSIQEIEKDFIQSSIPDHTSKIFSEYYQCNNCNKIYWKGSHYDKMLSFINTSMQL